MVDERDIRRSAEYTDRWLIRRQRRHISMIEKSIEIAQQLRNEGIVTEIDLLRRGTLHNRRRTLMLGRLRSTG